MDDVDLLVTALYRAQKTGEPLKINYSGGSQPNTSRTIFPLDIRHSEVTVQCLTTEKEKTLELEKMSLCVNQERPAYDMSNIYHDTLEELLEEDGESLSEACKNAGFEVALRKNNIKIFYIKEENGKKKKVDILRLYDNPFNIDEINVFSRKPYLNKVVDIHSAKEEFLSRLEKVKANYQSMQ
ncbi:hypothetical protein MSP8886_01444 [Marinomonas spartinae]|uniref:Uncharacterized protein n=1 Tax=Marinomonas spartinae TaxID=1792290 RepID=A0A1A8TBE0_9GAMM|nr:hypothetical protein [Marinomonas spartinae]SBS29115.1 hypothetical protein MSP8886_01444 [Marinomonas spartinae]